MTDDYLVWANEHRAYLVWSNEHRAWWGPGGRGYVKGLNRAGRYSRERAFEICRNALGTAGHIGVIAEIPVRLDDMYDFLTREPIVPAVVWEGDE